jgi:hypothetical protein
MAAQCLADSTIVETQEQLAMGMNYLSPRSLAFWSQIA